MKKTEIFCDVCKSTDKVGEALKIQVIFTTNQTDGYPVAPHLLNEVLDICNSCMEKITSGNYIFAHGAQGYNTYYFKEEK